MYRAPSFTLMAALLAAIPMAAQVTLRPPLVNPDKSVTFTLNAPLAAKVYLGGEFDDRYNRPPGAEMTKDDKGVWTFTTAPLAPGIYYYGFVVDDLFVIDPGNTRYRAEIRSGGPINNLLEVKGDQPFPFDLSPETPRGVVHIETFRSGVLNRDVTGYVYTPPGYDDNQARRYPVLYLLHGNPGTGSEWTAFGFADRILDNLMAAGKAREMIVVMLDSQVPNATVLAGYELVEKYLHQEIIPRTESRYRADAASSNRWLAGISRGAAHASFVAFRRPDLFSALGSFSFGLPPSFPDSYPSVADVSKLNRQIPVIYYACAEEDTRVIQGFRTGIDALAKAGVRFESKLVPPGSHSWQIWRDALADFVTRLR